MCGAERPQCDGFYVIGVQKEFLCGQPLFLRYLCLIKNNNCLPHLPLFLRLPAARLCTLRLQPLLFAPPAEGAASHAGLPRSFCVRRIFRVFSSLML